MKKIILSLLVISLIAGCEKSLIENTNQEELMLKKGKVEKVECTTIQSGELFTSTGEVIEPGFMENGYNYQAHIYKGDYGYGDAVHLVMKWNDAWLSNKDCDGDGLLDRPLDENGAQYYYGSGAWCTNHWTEVYTNEDGEECHYSEFIKIVAVPVDAYKENGFFYTADGNEIGEVIWGQFAIIQYIVNDPCEGVHGIQYKSPDHAGLGNW